MDHIVHRLIDIARWDPKDAIALGLRPFGLALVSVLIIVPGAVDLNGESI